MRIKALLTGGMVSASLLISACATLEDVVSPPEISLRNVHVESLDLGGQTFLLAFNVSNPNPFPLPITTISYGVLLDGHRFASGEAQCSYTVPAGSDGEFTISVDLNLLKTAPELLFIVRDGVRRDIPYTLEGRLGVDIPFARPVNFENNGLIRLQASAY